MNDDSVKENNGMTRVTFLTGEYPPMQGGIADYTARLAANLKPLNADPAVLISRKYPADAIAAPPDVPVFPALSGWGWRSWREIRRFLAAHPTDVLHIQYQAAAFDLTGWVNWLPWYLRRFPHCPKIVTTFHDLRVPYLFPKAGNLRWRAMLSLAKHSDAVICTNAEDTATLRAYPWGAHVFEIPLGNNVPVAPPPAYDRSAWRAKLGVNPDSLVMVYFGFLNESKGGETLIAVLDALVRQNVDARLLMVGGDVGDSDPANAEYARRVRRMIAERGLADRIIATGFVPLIDVSAHLLAADVAVLPYVDGVSFRRTTLLAVLAHGVPVVTTAPVHSLPQIVANETMLLAPPGNVPVLTAAVMRLAKSSALRVRLSAGAKSLSEQFNWHEIAHQTTNVYRV